MIRVAIYFTPASDTSLALTAAEWLGRDSNAATVPLSPFNGLSQEKLAMYLASPVHYGFHATIKPPFPLEYKSNIDSVIRRLQQYTANKTSFSLPPLELDFLDDFFCLRPSSACQQLHDLADDVVRKFDDLRQPASKKEILQRRKAGLTENQDNMLLRWGYPFVMSEFRFHMTLTGRITDQHDKIIVHKELVKRFRKEICSDITFSGLSLFIEKNHKPLFLREFFPFGSA